MVENDCEDQGYGLMSDGCTNCRVWLPGGKKVGVALEKRKQNGGEFWVCPSCDGSYGPAPTVSVAHKG